jgi:hypothetical protein
MIRKGLRPGFRIGLDLPGERDGMRQVLPFRRSWIAIGILAVMDIIFIFPAVGALRQAAEGWAEFDSLFDLVFTLFISGWVLGWSIAPLLMTGILLLMLFGREVLKARPGTVEILIGLPLFGIGAIYEASKMRNLRIEHPLKKSGKSWRGSHLVFDYGANSVAVGSAISDEELNDLKARIQMATGTALRRGDASPEELQIKWAEEKQESTPLPLADPVTEIAPVTLSSSSTLALIVANLIPIAGTLFLGWKLSDVMVLYWAESAVIGFFNLCKIAVIGRWMALLAGPFFVGHFGGFMAVHFLFIYTIFVEGLQNSTSAGGDLGNVAKLFIGLWPALAALFASHAFSFFQNFIGRREYLKRTVQNQMSEPYSRIIFMHLILIFGGGVTMFLGETTPVLLIVIGLKIYFDVKAHMKERLRN